jgi:methyl-accepting chemotaxis protein
MQRLRIGTKILLVVILLTLVSLASAGFSASRMAAISSGYGNLLANDVTGSIMMARAGRVIQQTRGDAYALIAELDPAVLAALKQRFADDPAQFHKFVDAASATLPSQAATLADFAQRYDAIYKTLQQVADFGAQNKNDQALAAYGTVRGKIDELTDGFSKLVGDTVTATQGRAGDLADSSTSTIYSSLVIVAIGVLLGVGAAVFVSRVGIAKPIAIINQAMQRLAGGDKTIEIPGLGRGDEVGEMAKTVQVFKENMIEADRLRAEQELAKRQAEEQRRSGMLALADRFESSVGGVVNGVSAAATELQSTAETMAASAEQTSRQSSVVAAASEETTRNVQTVASATEELSASIGEITSQVTESTRIVGEAVGQAQDTMRKVQSLSEAAQKIGDVVRLINDIAGQTNLLALNATIEAARAGEAGKGFAVVASEVKTLATQTAKATDEIASQVRAIQEATTSSATAMSQIAGTINRVNEIATAIASAVEEQGAATQEISRNVQQAAQGTQEVSLNIGGVSQAAGQSGAAARQVLESADELSKSGSKLQTEVQEFLRTVRAA